MPWPIAKPSGAAPAAGSAASPRAARTGLQRAVLALASTFALVGLLSCGSSPSTQNPSTLWLSFGQSELDLILSATEPPYY